MRTKRFSFIFEKLGSFRSTRYISWIFLVLVPFIAGIALYLIVNSLIGLLNNPGIGQVARELGPGTILLLPGINPILPVFYGWIAIVLAIAIHEGAHGVIARNVGLKVKSSGLLFFLIIPIGAFVDVDEEQIKKAKPRSSLKVMAAGVGGNIIVGALCLLSVIVLVGGLVPVIDGGVYVGEVTEGMPAQAAGLLPKDVIVSIDSIIISNSTDLRALLDTKTSGEMVNVTVARGESWQYRFSTIVNLTVSENRTVMGISAGDLMTEERLQYYQDFSLDKLSLYIVPPTLASGIVPFSDSLAMFYYSHVPYWNVIANVLFWVWFVNFNLAIFNALPLYPLDGGRIFNITLKKLLGGRVSEKAIYLTTLAATAVCIVLVVSITVLPFIL